MDDDDLIRELDKTFRLIDERAELLAQFYGQPPRIIGQLPPIEFTDADVRFLKSLRISAE